MLRSLLFAAFLALAATACKSSPTGMGEKLDLGLAMLPDDLSGLLAIADSAYNETRALEPSARAVAALNKALRVAPESYEARWRSARALLVLATVVQKPPFEGGFAKDGVRHGRAATRLQPDRPEGWYYLAACLGVAAKASVAPTRQEQQAVVEPLERLMKLQPGFEQGGALRLLGTLYTRAPSWPAGVGDLDEGLNLLERASTEFPRHPLNLFFYAEALAKSGNKAEAVAALRRVLQVKTNGLWKLDGAPFRAKARQMLSDLRAPGGTR